MSPRPRRIAEPQAAVVRAGAGGVPLHVDRRAVDAVRETWLVEDRWWTEHPLRRRYWEVVTACGRNVVVFHDLVEGEPESADPPRIQADRGWYSQR